MTTQRASLPPPLKRRALGVSVVEGVLHAVMLGASESYLGALAVELGHGPRSLSLLAAVPLVAGALAQLASSMLVSVLGTPKRVAVWGASIQAVSHLGLVYIAHAHERSLAPLLLVKTLFWMSGTAIVPAWGAWMAGLIDGAARERYFAWRSAAVYAALVASFVGCGIALHRSEGEGLLSVFAAMFCVGGVARALSVGFLLAQAQGRGGAFDDSPRATAPLSRFGHALRDGEWRTPLYIAGLMCGVHLSVPFFTPYMLRELSLDYGTFVALTATSIVAKALVFPLCHRLASRFGLRALLLASGVGISALPALWAVTPRVELLFGVEVLGGSMWAGLEYASFQLILQSAREPFRVELLAISGSITGIAQLAGAYSGALLLEHPAFSYRGVFWTSAVLRALSLGILVFAMPKLRLDHTLIRIVTRLFTIRPNAGAVQRVAVLDEEEPPPT